jgi:hypothetical protein
MEMDLCKGAQRASDVSDSQGCLKASSVVMRDAGSRASILSSNPTHTLLKSVLGRVVIDPAQPSLSTPYPSEVSAMKSRDRSAPTLAMSAPSSKPPERQHGITSHPISLVYQALFHGGCS